MIKLDEVSMNLSDSVPSVESVPGMTEEGDPDVGTSSTRVTSFLLFSLLVCALGRKEGTGKTEW